MLEALSWYVLSLLLSSVPQIPKQPDFSGEWISIATDASVDPPATLVVRQRLTRANSRGEPMAPYFSHLLVERHYSNRVESDSYDIGIVSGTVSGTGERTIVTVTWQGERLAIKTGKYSGPPQEPGPSSEHEEVWSLDRGGRLLITITDRTSGAQSTTVRLTYQRRAAQ
jgi:hypothetical protein